jgi:hypothetical protein
VPSLRLILKDGSSKAIVYAHLDSHDPGGCEFILSAPGGTGNVIKLRVDRHSRVFMVIILGVRLWRVCELIMDHKTPWIHELPTGLAFGCDNQPVIKSITFQAVPA